MSRFNTKKMIVVDLESGRYVKDKKGHEFKNLTSENGMYYGYIPPWDGADIKNFGAVSKDLSVDGVLVVYVKKKPNSSDREIIAFCPSATVFKHGQNDMAKTRTFIENGQNKTATYSIKSETLISIEDRLNKFTIKLKDWSIQMFRKQRFYGGKYPELDKRIIDYIEGVLENKLDDNVEEQEKIQEAEPATPKEKQGSADEPLKIVDSNQGKAIAKNNRLAKSVLIDAKYLCQIDPSHTTFLTNHQVPYMEGHHLIPCTVKNSKIFIDKKKGGKNIDCVENIVCICPNCHRAVHFGDDRTKKEKIRTMFNKQSEKLAKVGILITEDELLELY